MTSFCFKGQRVLVTGGSGGLGSSIVRKFYEAGATVFALDWDKKSLLDLQKELPELKIVEADLTKWSEVRAIVEELGPLDHLVNNAGTAIISTSLTTTEEELDKIFALNFKAALNLSQVFANQVISRKAPNATIVNISSTAAQHYFAHVGPSYCCSKAALNMLTTALAVDLAPFGIRVNSVLPTAMITPMLKSNAEIKECALKAIERSPMKGFAETGDIAHLTLYLSSPQSQMITGTAIPVDGGFLVS